MAINTRPANFLSTLALILTTGEYGLYPPSDVHLQTGRPISRYDNSPKNKAFDFILQGSLSREVIELLSCLTEGSDFIEEQGYTLMHKIVLGLSLKSLEEELIHHPEDIDAMDALG